MKIGDTVELKTGKEKFMVFVEGGQTPKKIHETYTTAEKEALRLAEKERKPTFVCEVVASFELIITTKKTIHG